MSETPNDSVEQLPQEKGFWRRQFSWHGLRRALIGLVVVITLIALVVTEEDWRGKHDWENYRRDLEAKGEHLDWQAFVPATVPDDLNFFTAPIFTNMLQKRISMTPYGNDGGPDFRPDANQSGYVIYRMQLTDLATWQNYYRNPAIIHTVSEFTVTNGLMEEQTNYLNHVTDEFPIASKPQTPAKDVLLALSKFDSAVDELRQASERPYSRIPMNYADSFDGWSSLSSYLAALKRCSQLLQLRANAELADGQSAKALDDEKLLLHLNNSLRASPFLISLLVRIAIVNIDLQSIWEGLAEHKWSNDQLVALETELGKLDFLADYQTVMRSECAASIAKIDDWRQHRNEVVLSSFNSSIQENDDKGIRNIISNWAKADGCYLMPDGWFYQNEMNVARMHAAWDPTMVNAAQRIASPKTIQAADLSFSKPVLPWNMFARQILPLLGASARKASQVQTAVNLARTACVLERYRLAHGEYPERLDTLTPQFITEVPTDIINGQPLHYRRTSDGQFVLYSVGWNETNDGGHVVLNKSGTVDRDKGDWVWQYPPKN